MNTVVCVKLVPDTHLPLEIDPQTGTINSDDLVYVISPGDQAAVEEAVRLKEAGLVTQVTLVCMGSPSAVRGLRSCLALGADRAILLNDPAFEGSDSYATAVVLSKAISSLPHDLILCGTRAADTNSGLVGAVIAEILGISLVSEVTRINAAADGGKVIVHRKLEKGDREVVEVDLPALLTVEVEVPAARYASLPSLMAAQIEEIEELDLKALGLSSLEVGSRGAKIEILRFAPLKPRRRKLFTPDASLSAVEKIGMIMTGGITEKKTEFLEGEPKKIAATLLQFLAQQKLLRVDSTAPQQRHES